MIKISPSKLLLFVIVWILIISCSTVTGPPFTQEPISADADPNLYLYRPSSWLMSGADWEFVIDKDVIVNLSNGTYVKLPIKPGTHEIISAPAKSVDQPWLKFEFEAVKGKNSYVKYEMQTKHGVFFSIFIARPIFNNRLYELDEVQAVAELNELRLTKLPQRKY